MELEINLSEKDITLFEKMIKEKYPELRGWKAHEIRVTETLAKNVFTMNIVMRKEDKPMKPEKHEEKEEKPEKKKITLSPTGFNAPRTTSGNLKHPPKKSGRPKLNPENVEAQVLEYFEKKQPEKPLPLYIISKEVGISRPYIEKALLKLEKRGAVHSPTKRWGSKQWSLGKEPIKSDPYHKDKFEKLYDGETYDMIKGFIKACIGKNFDFTRLEMAHIIEEDKMDSLFNDLQNNKTLLVKKLEMELSVTLKPVVIGNTKLIEVMGTIKV